MRIGFFLLLTLPVWASEVLEVAPRTLEISSAKPRPWEIEDRVCVNRRGKRIACGYVIDTTEKGNATVDLYYRRQSHSTEEWEDSITLRFNEEVARKGDTVTLDAKSLRPKYVDDTPLNSELEHENLLALEKASPASRGLASTDEASFLKFREENKTTGHLSNVSAGMNYVFPNFQYHQAVSDHSATGVMPIYLSGPAGDGALSGFGAFFNYHYYSNKPFDGYWLQAGLGLYALKATKGALSGNGLSFAGSVAVGKRWLWKDGLNFGFAVGLQKLLNSNPGSVPLNFSGIYPALVMDLGYAF